MKHYSSGMYVRLGFAVAVNVEPDVLLVDEVLAVGDEAFQRKCLDRVRQFQRDGRTIVFVTHGADLVRQICDRAAVLDHGRMVGLGLPGEAVRVYREHLLPGEAYAEEPVEGEVPVAAPRRDARLRIASVAIEHPGTGSRPYLLSGEPLVVRVRFEALEQVDDVSFGIAIHDASGKQFYGTNTHILGVPAAPVGPGTGEVSFAFERVPFLDGTYLVTLGVTTEDEGTVYDWREQQDTFEVMNPGRTVGLVELPVRVEVSRGG